MSWSDLPSLNSLRAFATVAETGSFTQAGTTLNVSHAAVSQQVKALEARLGMTLVTREGRGITPYVASHSIQQTVTVDPAKGLSGPDS